ncbi:uncharacterized protein LOC115878369 [Sitophilus oryzae]|uniref:Uncharacterized protein LOC115878369 n=1 Tax=Sitophilus oryzae TaxID=7048 RepID=A0A6J2XHF2_SITOR|nr:uncharacterized protein LOC115878369 [Sitophilus oryzae]
MMDIVKSNCSSGLSDNCCNNHVFIPLDVCFTDLIEQSFGQFSVKPISYSDEDSRSAIDLQNCNVEEYTISLVESDNVIEESGIDIKRTKSNSNECEITDCFISRDHRRKKNNDTNKKIGKTRRGKSKIYQIPSFLYVTPAKDSIEDTPEFKKLLKPKASADASRLGQSLFRCQYSPCPFKTKKYEELDTHEWVQHKIGSESTFTTDCIEVEIECHRCSFKTKHRKVFKQH